MRNPPSDLPLRGGEMPAAVSQAPEGDGRAPGLPDLIRQREQFANDVVRLEAGLAQGAEESPGLYERLLRCRRISGKLENRIQLVQLQQNLHDRK